MSRLYIAAGALAVLVAAYFTGDRAGYQRGVSETVTAYRDIDQKGAKHARETAKRVLDGIGGVDPIELLAKTDGLRD